MRSGRVILLLGAYGLGGRAILRQIVRLPECHVIISGRDTARLAALAADFSGIASIEMLPLDVSNNNALMQACERADLVINAVGPYARHGHAVAHAAVSSGRKYLDFANEQIHFNRLAEMKDLIKKSGAVVLTASGAIPGMSTLAAAQLLETHRDVDSLDICWAQGRMPDADGGVGSLMSGILEAGHRPLALQGGELVPVQLGERWKNFDLPSPFGATRMLGLPTIDTQILPRGYPQVKNLMTWWDFGDLPPGVLHIIRLLKPHQRGWSYRLCKRLAQHINKREFEHAKRSGKSARCVLYLHALAGPKRIESCYFFPDGGTATAILPAYFAGRFLDGHAPAPGLYTPADMLSRQVRTEMLAPFENESAL